MARDGKLWENVKARHDAYDKQKMKELKNQLRVDGTPRENKNIKKPTGVVSGVRG